MEDILDVNYRDAKILVIIIIYMFKIIRYYLLMYLKILEINALKYINMIQLIFYLHLDYSMASLLKENRNKIRIANKYVVNG